jgi:hypothetical protein
MRAWKVSAIVAVLWFAFCAKDIDYLNIFCIWLVVVVSYSRKFTCMVGAGGGFDRPSKGIYTCT